MKLHRSMEPWSSYFVLPVFALANAGVVWSADIFAGYERLMLAIILGWSSANRSELSLEPGLRCAFHSGTSVCG